MPSGLAYFCLLNTYDIGSLLLCSKLIFFPFFLFCVYRCLSSCMCIMNLQYPKKPEEGTGWPTVVSYHVGSGD